MGSFVSFARLVEAWSESWGETYDPVQPRDTLNTVEDTAVSVTEGVAVQSAAETLGQSGNSRHPERVGTSVSAHPSREKSMRARLT